MLARTSRDALVGLAIAASLTACSSQPKPPVITAQNAALAQHVGAQLAAKEREETARHRAEIAKLIYVNLSHATETDRTLTLAVHTTNFTPKTINALELGLEVDDAQGNALGRCELRSGKTVDAKSQTTIAFAMPYTKFGSGTAAVREALGKPKRYLLDVKEIKYTDGSDAGYDD